MGEIAAGVGEDYVDARGDGAEDGGGGHEEEVDARAAGFVAVVEYWLADPYHWEVWVHEINVHGVRRADEYNCLMLLHFLPEWTEIGMPEVVIVVTVTRIESYTVGF